MKEVHLTAYACLLCGAEYRDPDDALRHELSCRFRELAQAEADLAGHGVDHRLPAHVAETLTSMSDSDLYAIARVAFDAIETRPDPARQLPEPHVWNTTYQAGPRRPS